MMGDTIQEIVKLRKENEKGEVICIREINENIKRVLNNKPLTRPLSVLNKSCQFQKRYELAFDLENEDRINEEVRKKRREYIQRPEVKIILRKYSKKYQQRPEVKQRRIQKCLLKDQ